MTTSIEVNQQGKAFRILAVIVVYKMNPLHTSSFVSLRRAEESLPPGRASLGILLFDNSGDAEAPECLPKGVEYHRASANMGLSSAYNHALRVATSQGYDWLLTLDQDSRLPPNFLDRIARIADAAEADASIAAIVPLIIESGKTHSPYWFLAGAFPCYHTALTSGVSVHDTYAFNSAATLRVSALMEVGGYNPWFWLDYSDGYIFRQLHRRGKRVFVVADVQVEHDFATTNLEAKVSLGRYRNMRLAESAFWDLEMGVLAGLERTLGLVLVMARHIAFNHSREYRGITFEFLKRRLFWSRKKRLEAWEEETRARFPSLRKRTPPFIE